MTQKQQPKIWSSFVQCYVLCVVWSLIITFVPWARHIIIVSNSMKLFLFLWFNISAFKSKKYHFTWRMFDKRQQIGSVNWYTTLAGQANLCHILKSNWKKKLIRKAKPKDLWGNRMILNKLQIKSAGTTLESGDTLIYFYSLFIVPNTDYYFIILFSCDSGTIKLGSWI